MTRLAYVPDRIIDHNGIADGATVSVYLAGTTTPVEIFSDPGMTVPMANPFTVAAGAAFPSVYYDLTDIKLTIVSTDGSISEYDPYTPLSLTISISSVRDHGATGDGVTDDYNAFVAAIADLPERGGSLYIPRGYYRLSQKIISTKQVRIYGEGWSQNPGTVGGVSYSGVEIYTGSIIVSDADVGGIQFVGFTDNASNNPAYEYQSSLGSIIQDVMFYSLGGTGTTSHGIESFVNLNLTNVRVEGYAGCGVKIVGDGSGTANQYGNTALTSLRSVSCRFNKLHGFQISGGNSSVIHFLGCDSAGNGGVGFLDSTPFGNFYAGCHTALNNTSYGTPAGYSAAQRTKNTTDWAGLSDQLAGSFVATEAQSYNVYSGCYTEVEGRGAKAELTAAALVIGGLLGTDAAHTLNSVSGRWTRDTIKNVHKIYSDTTGIVELAKGMFDITDDNGAGYVGPSTGGRLQWTGFYGLMLGGVGSSYDLGLRNAASVPVMLLPHNSTVPWFPDKITTDNGYQVAGTKVVGTQGAAVANGVDAVAAPTQAEFNALNAQFNALLARLRAHGLIVT